MKLHLNEEEKRLDFLLGLFSSFGFASLALFLVLILGELTGSEFYPFFGLFVLFVFAIPIWILFHFSRRRRFLSLGISNYIVLGMFILIGVLVEQSLSLGALSDITLFILTAIIFFAYVVITWALFFISSRLGSGKGEKGRDEPKL